MRPTEAAGKTKKFQFMLFGVKRIRIGASIQRLSICLYATQSRIAVESLMLCDCGW